MRRTITILSAFMAMALTACSPDLADTKGQPTAVASSTATTSPGDKDAVCLGYRQRHEDMAATFLRAAPVLLDPSASASQLETASTQAKQGYTQLRSWMETQLAGTADPKIKSAFERFVALLKQSLTELEAAGRDGLKIMTVLADGRVTAAEKEVLEACEGHGLLPHATP